MIVMERARSPKHQHTGGELIVSLAGQLEDVTDQGTPVLLGVGDVIFHEAGSIHEPNAPDFWVGLYFQPEGSVLVDMVAAS